MVVHAHISARFHPSLQPLSLRCNPSSRESLSLRLFRLKPTATRPHMHAPDPDMLADRLFVAKITHSTITTSTPPPMQTLRFNVSSFFCAWCSLTRACQGIVYRLRG